MNCRRLDGPMRDLDQLFVALRRSNFRKRQRLARKERALLAEKSLPVVLDNARRFVRERLADPHPKRDGKQTPMRGHPVFVAQHATATCCRGCLNKWHGIEQGIALTDEQTDYIIRVIERWLSEQGPFETTDVQQRFDWD